MYSLSRATYSELLRSVPAPMYLLTRLSVWLLRRLRPNI